MNDNKQLVADLYCDKRYFSLNAPLYHEFFNSYIDAVLNADLGDKGDISTYVVSDMLPKKVTATLIAKSDGVFSGAEELTYICKANKIKVGSVIKSGESFIEGDILCSLSGAPAALLRVERTLLNLLQRMCGIATQARQFKTKHTAVAATRKTLLSLIDKKAALDGGVLPHRINLEDAIMIKDTHLDLFDRDIVDLFGELKKHKAHLGRFVVIEVENQTEALEVTQIVKDSPLPVPVVVMLDNFAPHEVRDTLKLLEAANTRLSVLIEVSGGISEKNYTQYDIEGVDVMSIGEITHSVSGADISMKIA